jgi:hypothetical protein
LYADITDSSGGYSSPDPHLPSEAGQHERSATRRIIAIVVALLTLGLGFVTPSVAQAATGYRLNWTYAGGGTGSQTYSSQYQWLVDATHIDERAYVWSSGVVKLTNTDLNNNAAVTATFDAVGTGIHTYSNGNDGQYDWLELGYYYDCSNFPYYGYETQALAYYLTNAAYYAGGHNGGARIYAAPSASGNVFGVGCGVYG